LVTVSSWNDACLPSHVVSLQLIQILMKI